MTPPLADRRALPWVVGALVAAPVLAAVLAQRGTAWHPVFDLAMTELRVRDVGGGHTPLIGLQGRIGETGSHPGPLSFYLLAPVYRLLGSTSFALQAATGVLHVGAVATTLWVVQRRRQPLLVVAVGVLLLLLIQGYGLGSLVEPWNPYLPVLWFVAFLVAVWAVVDGDTAMLVPAVAAASLCAQTHVPYLAVTGAIGGGAAVLVATRALRRRRAPVADEDADGGPEEARARTWRWLAVAAAVGALLWSPAVLDELRNEPGNLSVLVEHFSEPQEEVLGVRAAGHLVLARLDPWHLVVVGPNHPGTYVDILSGPGPREGRGIAMTVAWAVAVGAAAWMRHRRLLALHAVVATGTAVAVLAVSRIFGPAWPYLMHWAFSLGALMLLATAWTLLIAVRRWRPGLGTSPRAATVAAPAVALLALAAVSARLLVLAPDARPHTPELTTQLGRVAPAVAQALDDEEGAATGDDGRYLVYWDDAVNGGSQGIGLVNELIRRGFDVGVDERDAVRIVPFRVRPPAEATARVVLATGGWVERWQAEEGAVRVVYDDPRTPAERTEHAALRAEVAAALERLGRPDLVERLDRDLFDIALNEGLPAELAPLLGRMIDIGAPLAVFVLPPGPVG